MHIRLLRGEECSPASDRVRAGIECLARDRSVTDAARCHDRQADLAQRVNELEQRRLALHMPAGFETLRDQDVGPGRDSFARCADIRDLRENDRTRAARLGKQIMVDAPRERDGRRALGQRDRESLALVEREDEVDAERSLVELRSNALQLFAKLLRFGPRSRQRAEAPLRRTPP